MSKYEHNHLTNPFSSLESGFLDSHELLTPQEIFQEDQLVISGLLNQIDAARAEGFMEAATDPVTGLPNRAYFERQLIKTDASNEPYSVAVLDITALKKLNDAKGHMSGDNLLHAAGQAIQNAIRKDDFVARIGGDEFAVIVSDVPHTDDTLKTEQRNKAFTRAVLEGLEKYAKEEGLTQYGINIAVGIAPHEPGQSSEETMQNADKLMYRHKQLQHTENGGSYR